MGIEAEKFKKKWKRNHGGNTSNEESDEKSPKNGFKRFGD